MPEDVTKKPSGAQYAKMRKEREEQERKDERKRRLAGDVPDHVKPFLAAGPPPIGDPVAGVKWANDVAMTLLNEVLADPQFTFEKRLRYATDLIGKVGLLHSKAHVQKRIADLTEKDDPDTDPDDGLESNPLYRSSSEGRGGEEEG